MSRAASATGVIAGLTALCSIASAQWINVKIPGTPRTKDGKADLSAPAPRTADGKPDLTGIWMYYLWSGDRLKALSLGPPPASTSGPSERSGAAAANAPNSGRASDGSRTGGGGGGFNRI